MSYHFRRSLLIGFVACVFLGVSLLGCSPTSSATAAPTFTPLQTQAQQWIAQHAVPLATTDPTASLVDLQALTRIVGNKTIVGLGEATHGTHEFFTMKHRILEYLVEKLGFTTFAIEGSWTAGMAANAYVLHGIGTARNALNLFAFWTWNTQEVLDLMQWMRTYNLDPTHLVKVQFAGFDCQEIEPPTFDSVTGYFQQVDPQDAGQVATLYASIRPTANTFEAMDSYLQYYIGLPVATKKIYAAHAQSVYDLLASHQVQDTARSSAQAFALALQNARVIVQTTQLFTFDTSDPIQFAALGNYRDAAMAENIGWMQAHGAGKLVLWAHDLHIGTAAFQTGYVTMGMHLRQQFRANYLTILTSFYEGTFYAFPYTSDGIAESLRPNQVETAPLPTSYNAVLGSISAPNYLLDLSTVPTSGPIYQWFAGPRPFIVISTGYLPTDLPHSIYYSMSLLQDADVIISLQHTTATQLLPFT